MREAFRPGMRKAISLIPLFLLLAGSAFAQNGKVSAQPSPQSEQQDRRGSLLREIGLSPDQMLQLRKLNMERRPLVEAAQRRLREANRLLDDAIYADDLNENEIQSRLQEAQHAQAELFRIRSTSELAIRRILTPDQLVRFRDLRKLMEDRARQNMEVRRNQNRRKRNAAPGTIKDQDGSKQPHPMLEQDLVPKHT